MCIVDLDFAIGWDRFGWIGFDRYFGNGRISKDIVDTAIASGNFKTLVSAVQAAGLVNTLKGQGPFKVFAPTDEAFAKIPEHQRCALLANETQLTAVLTYHVVPGKVMSTDLRT